MSRMRLSTLVIVPVIASAVWAMPVENIHQGKGAGSLSSSEGQVPSGTWGWLSNLWKTIRQSAVPNGQQSSVAKDSTIIENCEFCRKGTECGNPDSPQDVRADKFARWIVESAVDNFYEDISRNEGPGIKFKLGNKVHYPWTFEDLVEQDGVVFRIYGVPKLGTVVLEVHLYRTPGGGSMDMMGYYGKGSEPKFDRQDLSSGWEKELTPSELELFLKPF
ncbi:hypothetical protein C8R42DRAFT_717169 [Lentinula raphanica]|nr:hypothetical protein C8R42DRAFT_717169 [Lentinula raphanica]